MAVKSINEIIPRLQQTTTGVTSTPAVYIDDMFDPLFNKYAREYLRQKYGDNPILNTLAGYGEGIANAWGNKQGKGILGPTMGVLGYFGRSLDKADDLLLGSLIEGTDPTGFNNPLEQIFIEDRPYEGKELIKNLLNQTRNDPNKMVTDEDLKGFLPTIGGLAIDLATDPGILGGTLAKIGAKSSKPILKNFGKVGELMSEYDDVAAMLAWNAVAPGSTFAAKKFLGKINDVIGRPEAKDIVNVDIPAEQAGKRTIESPVINENLLPKESPFTTWTRNSIEKVKASYKPVDMVNPEVRDIAQQVSKIESQLPQPKTNVTQDTTLYSGGALGADSLFQAKGANSFNKVEVFRPETIKTLDPNKIQKIDNTLQQVSKTLNKNMPTNEYVLNLQRRNYLIVENADTVYAVGKLDSPTLVSGGTGWGVETSKLLNKKINFFDQIEGKWYNWDYNTKSFVEIPAPVLGKENIAGIGTRELNDKGKQAIENLMSTGTPLTKEIRPKGEFTEWEPIVSFDDTLKAIEEQTNKNTSDVIQNISKNQPKDPLPYAPSERPYFNTDDISEIQYLYNKTKKQMTSVDAEDLFTGKEIETFYELEDIIKNQGIREYLDTLPQGDVAEGIRLGQDLRNRIKEFAQKYAPEKFEQLGSAPKRFIIRPSQYSTLGYYAPVKKYTDGQMAILKNMLEKKAGKVLTREEAAQQLKSIFGITPEIETLARASKDVQFKDIRNLSYAIDSMTYNMYGQWKTIFKGKDKTNAFRNTFEAYAKNIEDISESVLNPRTLGFLNNSRALLKDADRPFVDFILRFGTDTDALIKNVKGVIANNLSIAEDLAGSSAIRLGTLSPLQQFLDTYPFAGSKKLYAMIQNGTPMEQADLVKMLLESDQKDIQKLADLFPGFEITDTITNKKYKAFVKTNLETGLVFDVTKKSAFDVGYNDMVVKLTAKDLPVTPDPIAVVKQTLEVTPIEGVRNSALRQALKETYGDAIPKGVDPIDYAKTVSPFEPAGRDSLYNRVNKAMVGDVDVVNKNKIASQDNPLLSEATARMNTVKDKAVHKQVIKAIDEGQSYTTARGTFLRDLIGSRGIKLTIAPTQEAYQQLRTKLLTIAAKVNKAAGAEVLLVNKENARRIVGIQFNTKLSGFQNRLAKLAKLEIAGKFDIEDVTWWVNKELGTAIPEFTGDAKILMDAHRVATREVQKHVVKLGHKEALDIRLKDSRNYLHHSAIKNDKYQQALLDTFDNVDFKEFGNYSMSLSNYLQLNKKFMSSMPSRSFEGPMSLYKDKQLGSLFIDDDLAKIANASMADGVLDNQNYQRFLNFFENDNLKVKTMFPDKEALKNALRAEGFDGKIGGNISQFDLVTPIYKDGTLVELRRFDKFSDKGLEAALANEDTVLIPNALYAPLDRILKKDVMLSNKAYLILNKYFTLPFKFGVLMNPAFPIGNVSDAFYKSVITNQMKFGKSFVQASVDLTAAMGDVIRLNNRVYDFIERYSKEFAGPYELVTPEILIKDSKQREKIFKYLDAFTDAQKVEDKELLKVWLMLNSVQDTTVNSGFSKSLLKKFNEGLKKNAELGTELSKGVDIDVNELISKYTVQTNIGDKILYGTDKTWGLFLNNPYSRAIMGSSRSIENLMRSAHILSNLKYNGAIDYINKKMPVLANKLDITSQELNIKLLNAFNTTSAAHFNYDNVTKLMAGLSYAIPFPTFFIKNLGFWLNAAFENPQILDNLLSVHENLWVDKNAEVQEDEFVGEAKGRGAIPALGSIYKPTPYASAFSAFDTLTNPVPNIAYRLNPLTRALTQGVLPSEDVKYRPYTTDIYTKNVKRGDPNFSYLRYALQSANPFERQAQNLLRLPAKIESGRLQPADVLPSVFQPYFGKKKKKRKG